MVQTWIVWHETWHETVFGIFYCIEMVRIENNSICLKIRATLDFLGFLSAFGTFSHKMVQTWIVLHETLHTTLYRICYCVEMVRIENNSHMLEIMC